MLNSIFALNILGIPQEIFQTKCFNGDFSGDFVSFQKLEFFQNVQEVFLRNQNASNSRCPMLAAAGKIDTLLSSTKMVKN